MPAKYSHVKKRSASGLQRKTEHKDHRPTQPPNPHVDRTLTKAFSAVAQLERSIARILLLRYEADIARLFSTRLYSVALLHLPTFALRCVTLLGPGWLIWNANCEEVKDFFRTVIAMDMRQAGERVATKSVLWSYTALRHFAQSNGVPICPKRGLHSLRLLEFYPALQAHLETLESLPPPTFTKPPHLGALQDGATALLDACQLKYKSTSSISWASDWRVQVQMGYERLAQTLWGVAAEFDVRGYGLVLREKLTEKWCDCGCSTDHLGEVCERTVREEEDGATNRGSDPDTHSGKGGKGRVGAGKQREWDGRGSGVYGWETEEEEDIWDVELDFGAGGVASVEEGDEMTISEVMEWRFLKAEREKEQGNTAFRKGDFTGAVRHYEVAHEIEPELPHYQLNLAAAHLKLSNWIEAEMACTNALSQHQSSKGYYRRARARGMLGKADDAIKDLRAVLKLQPTNTEAIAELTALLPPPSPKSKKAKKSRPNPDPDIETKDGGTFSAPPIQSSSSSSAPPVRSSLSKTSISEHTCPKRTRDIPWPRTPTDEKKLKILLVPASAAELALEEYGKAYAREAAKAGGGCVRHGGGGGKTSAKTDGKGKGNLNPKATGKGEEGRRDTAKGKPVNAPPITPKAATSNNPKMREMKAILKAETVPYPSWERYVIKRVD